MLWTYQTIDAAMLAYTAHKDQKDKLGAPYIFHLMEVAEGVETEDETIVALLHDYLEDIHPEMTYEEALDMLDQFGKEIVDALWCLKHPRSEPYRDYILRVMENPLARRVKLSDLASNSDPSRLMLIPDADTRARLEKKYTMAKQLLQGGNTK